MHFSTTIVEAVTSDRLREAEGARLARDSTPQKPQARRRRRLRALAWRRAFAR